MAAAALIAISIAGLGTAVLVRLILDELAEPTDDGALDQPYEGGELVDDFA